MLLNVLMVVFTGVIAISGIVGLAVEAGGSMSDGLRLAYDIAGVAAWIVAAIAWGLRAWDYRKNAADKQKCVEAQQAERAAKTECEAARKTAANAVAEATLRANAEIDNIRRDWITRICQSGRRLGYDIAMDPVNMSISEVRPCSNAPHDPTD